MLQTSYLRLRLLEALKNQGQESVTEQLILIQLEGNVLPIKNSIP